MTVKVIFNSAPDNMLDALMPCDVVTVSGDHSVMIDPTTLGIYHIAAVKAAEARIAELEAENALLKRAVAMLTRSLEDAEVESHAEP